MKNIYAPVEYTINDFNSNVILNQNVNKVVIETDKVNITLDNGNYTYIVNNGVLTIKENNSNNEFKQVSTTTVNTPPVIITSNDNITIPDPDTDMELQRYKETLILKKENPKSSLTDNDRYPILLTNNIYYNQITDKLHYLINKVIDENNLNTSRLNSYADYIIKKYDYIRSYNGTRMIIINFIRNKTGISVNTLLFLCDLFGLNPDIRKDGELGSYLKDKEEALMWWKYFIGYSCIDTTLKVLRPDAYFSDLIYLIYLNKRTITKCLNLNIEKHTTPTHSKIITSLKHLYLVETGRARIINYDLLETSLKISKILLPKNKQMELEDFIVNLQ